MWRTTEALGAVARVEEMKLTCFQACVDDVASPSPSGNDMQEPLRACNNVGSVPTINAPSATLQRKRNGGPRPVSYYGVKGWVPKTLSEASTESRAGGHHHVGACIKGTQTINLRGGKLACSW